MKRIGRHKDRTQTAIIPASTKQNHGPRQLVILGKIALGQTVAVGTKLEDEDTLLRGTVCYIHPRKRFFVVQGPWREAFHMPAEVRT